MIRLFLALLFCGMVVACGRDGAPTYTEKTKQQQAGEEQDSREIDRSHIRRGHNRPFILDRLLD